MDTAVLFQGAVFSSVAGLAGTILAFLQGKEADDVPRPGSNNFRSLVKSATAYAIFGGSWAWVSGSLKSGMVIFLSASLFSFLSLHRAFLRARARGKTIDKELPLLLDFLVLQVEAGHSISQALKSASELFSENNPIKEGLARFQQKIALGSPMRNSLEDLAAHLGTSHSQAAILAVSQAIAHGTPLGMILRDFSNRMRNHLILEGEKFANTLSIKLLIPLIFFIFPASFLVIFSPVLVSLQRVVQ